MAGEDSGVPQPSPAVEPDASDRPPASPPAATVVDLDWRSVVVFLLAFVSLVAVSGVINQATRTITWISVGSLLALALDPIITRVKPRVGGHRGVAVAIVLGGFLIGIAALAALIGPQVVQEARDLGDDLPAVVDDLGNLPLVGPQLRDADIADAIESFLDELPERLSGDTTPLEDAARSLLGGALAAVTTLLTTVTLLLDGERLQARLRRLVPPTRRPRADQLGRIAYRVVGQYFAGSVLVAAIAGVVMTVVGLVIGVPLAPLAGAWVAVTSLIPQIGGAAGGLLFVTLALTQGAGTGLVALTFFILYLQFENHVLSPFVVGRSVDLSPPATMTAALVGVSAAGVVGALVAIPLLSAAKAIYLELRPEAAAPS